MKVIFASPLKIQENFEISLLNVRCETNHSQKASKIRLYVESVLQNQFEHIK